MALFQYSLLRSGPEDGGLGTCTLLAILSGVLLVGCESLPRKSVFDYKDAGTAMARAAKATSPINVGKKIVLAPLVQTFHFDSRGNPDKEADDASWVGDQESAGLGELSYQTGIQIPGYLKKAGIDVYDFRHLKLNPVTAAAARNPTPFLINGASALSPATFSSGNWKQFEPNQTDTIRSVFKDASAVVFVRINSVWVRTGMVEFAGADSIDFQVRHHFAITSCKSSKDCQTRQTSALDSRVPVALRKVNFDTQNAVNEKTFGIYSEQLGLTLAELLRP